MVSSSALIPTSTYLFAFLRKLQTIMNGSLSFRAARNLWVKVENNSTSDDELH